MSPKTKRAIRTALQTLAAVAAVLPVLAAFLSDSALAVAAPWAVAAAGTAAVAAGIVARIMASDPFERLLDRFGIGLRDDTAPPTAPPAG
ncbi:hypothetical protein [Streptomyces sp. enrichment culture]|uniref:hypothetical protein n=1 Tax=Streptomyces sp. enrichment culture TaxID=1795815 RepID=UPI003F573412